MKRILALISMAVLAMGTQAQQPASPAPLAHTYRLTYTLTTMDAGKRTGVQTFAMTVAHPDSHNQAKVGQKVPVATGSYGDTKSNMQTQFTYLDVGILIDAMVSESPAGLVITSKLEQSSVAPQPVTISGVSEPLIRQIVLSNSSTIAVGKTVRIGSLDLPDTQRHVDVEVGVEELL